MGNNIFAYCINCPVNYTDPLGTYADVVDPLRGGKVGGGVVIPIPVFPAFDYLLDVVNDVKAWVEAKKGVTEYRNHSVYVLKDPTNNNLVKYVGRTNDPGRREQEHKNDPSRPWRADYKMVVLVTGLTKDEAMVVEQFLISAYTLGYLENARREISAKRVPQFEAYLGAIAEIHTGISGNTILDFMAGR